MIFSSDSIVEVNTVAPKGQNTATVQKTFPEICVGVLTFRATVDKSISSNNDKCNRSRCSTSSQNNNHIVPVSA